MGQEISSITGLPQERQREAKKALVGLARAIVAGTLNPVVGCRKIVRLRTQVFPQDLPAFDTVRAVESETDDYPVGDIRDRYDSGLLARLDESVGAYLRTVRPALLQACEEIIHQFDEERRESNSESGSSTD